MSKHYSRVSDGVETVRQYILNVMRETDEQFTLEQSKKIREQVVLLLLNVEDQTVSAPSDQETNP